jgi:ABC-type sugar transport system substrate-binding protein
MENLDFVISLMTADNDYQLEQAKSAQESARRLGVTLQVIYADNDAVNQSQQLLQVIQSSARRPDAILAEPVGTGMTQVARAASNAGIGWGILNREVDYIAELRENNGAPALSVGIDQEEVGRIQGRQFGIFLKEGNVLYIEGPSIGSVARLRSIGMYSTKPKDVKLKSLKGDWTQRSAYQAVRSWLSLSTSRELQIQAVGCQNDAMAIGAREALDGLIGTQAHAQWQNIPLVGCDGLPGTGKDWVRRGLMHATVVIPPTAGLALELMVQALKSGTCPPESTPSLPHSYPSLEDLNAKYRQRAQAAMA